MKRALTITAALCAGVMAMAAPATANVVGARVPARVAKSSTFVAQSLPAYYIADYKRAKLCKNLKTPPWLSFLSYASVKVSDEWRVYASSKSLCSIATRTADNMISEAPNDDGAGRSITNMISYAHRFHIAQTTSGLKPAGKSYRCERLPSFWGQQAYDLAEVAHRGVDDGAFAAASGPAAGAGFCETKAKRTKSKQYTGGSFFSWGPDTLTCQRAYKLKELPDPDNPGEFTSPPFPAALFGDYNEAAC